MKKVVYLSLSAFVVMLLILGSCKKKEAEPPCDGKGSITFTNKLDSAISINIIQIHYTFTLETNYSERVSLAGDSPYEIKITGADYYLNDTLMVATCDDLLMVVEPDK